MKIIAIAHRSETHSADDFAPHLAAEANHALGLYAEEIVREIYSRADGKGAAAIFGISLAIVPWLTVITAGPGILVI